MDYEIVRGNVLSATSIQPFGDDTVNGMNFTCIGDECSNIDNACDIDVDVKCLPVNVGCRYSCGGATKPCAEIMSTGSIG